MASVLIYTLDGVGPSYILVPWSTRDEQTKTLVESTAPDRVTQVLHVHSGRVVDELCAMYTTYKEAIAAACSIAMVMGFEINDPEEKVMNDINCTLQSLNPRVYEIAFDHGEMIPEIYYNELKKATEREDSVEEINFDGETIRIVIKPTESLSFEARAMVEAMRLGLGFSLDDSLEWENAE